MTSALPKRRTFVTVMGPQLRATSGHLRACCKKVKYHGERRF
jgi:hypothetical protein